MTKPGPRTLSVTAPDGVTLAAFDGGNRDGPEILFIHGFSQCSLCWRPQFDDPALARNFRLTAFDIRGHGQSEKPRDRARYASDATFAQDVDAVIKALGLRRPVIVGWSYAGRIINDYLAAFGTAGIAGINYVCARTRNDPEFNGPGCQWLAAMQENDAAVNATATRKFLTACFAVMPPPALFEDAFAYNMAVTPEIRSHHLTRPASDGAILATIDVPVLVSQGSEDQLVLQGLGALTARIVPGARLSLYEGIGHAPFIEDAQRFNRELADFVLTSSRRDAP